MMKRAQTPGWVRLRPRGFSLVELMIVVSIIAILAAFLAPSVSTFMRRSKGRSAARAVANVLRTAHQQAMTRGEVILATITTDAGVDGGRIELFRATNSGTPALSCAQAQSATLTSVMVVNLAQDHPDMMLLSMDPPASSGNARTICFAPGGRVLSTAGLAIESSNSACDATNLRLFVRQVDESITGTSNLLAHPISGGTALDACVDMINGNGTLNSSGQKKRESQRQGRDIANFWSIHVPYNGAIGVEQ